MSESVAVFGQAFWSERRARAGSERCSSLARPSSQRGGLESEVSVCSALARPSGQRLDHHSGLSFRYLGRLRSCASFVMLSAGPNL